MKYVRTHRGLSNVVTAAIMLTFVAVLGTAMVGWSNGNLKAFETSLVNTSSNMTNQINENFVIENVAFCKTCWSPPANSVINVTVTNTGSLPIQVTQIQINGTAVTSYKKSTTLPQVISPGQSYTVAALIPSSLKPSWYSKEPDTITVTTQRGNILTTQAAPP